MGKDKRGHHDNMSGRDWTKEVPAERMAISRNGTTQPSRHCSSAVESAPSWEKRTHTTEKRQGGMTRQHPCRSAGFKCCIHYLRRSGLKRNYQQIGKKASWSSSPRKTSSNALTTQESCFSPGKIFYRTNWN